MERHLLSRRPPGWRRRRRRLRRAGVLRRALRHGRGELELLRRARAADDEGVGRRARRANFEFSLKLYQKFTHPEMFHQATGKDPSSTRRQGRRRVPRAPSIRSPNAGKLGALLAQFPASFKNEANARGYLEWLLQAFKDYPLAVELRHRSFSDDPEETLRLLERARRGAGADRRAEVPAVDPPEPAAQRADVLLHAPARPERRAVVEAREVRGPLQLPVFGRRAGTRSPRPRKRRRAT